MIRARLAAVRRPVGAAVGSKVVPKIGGVLAAAALLIYLTYALLRPERF